jgi:hypothetical protein
MVCVGGAFTRQLRIDKPQCLLTTHMCACVCACRSVWDDYEADTELIGRGAFARVFRAIRREDGTPVAIKVIGRETKAFAQQRRGEGAGDCPQNHTREPSC